VYWPCDPASGGNLTTGAGCYASHGAGPYKFALKTANINPDPTNTGQYILGLPPAPGPITVVCPQVRIIGYSGSTGTCSQTAGTLAILTGGTADARSTQGNINDSRTHFAWVFTGGSGGTSTSQNPTVPPGVTGFSLTVTYPDGSQSTATGPVTQTDLVPAFSLSPNPVL